MFQRKLFLLLLLLLLNNTLVGDSVTGLATTKLTSKAAEAFLRDVLLNKQLRIEIWKQSRMEWQLIRQASPGNLQSVEDFLFSSTQMTSAPVVIAIKYGVSGDNKVNTLKTQHSRRY
jgi:DNA mismatch repair protein MSH2